PIEVDTYNFGSVDSIGVILFCAGKHRCSVPHARFLIHGVRFNVGNPQAFDEKQLEEHLKGLKIDQTNIARVIADTTGKPLHKVEEDMINRTTLSPIEAKDYGLVHEVKSTLFPIDADLSVIGEIVPNQPGFPLPFGITLQPAQAYTRSADLDFQS
ncbi:MAG: ATP-dependent Clp protease proteolytic subunit, partial [Bacteroidetes bacterium]|nr:ATP-dependent Clp protease proteolytic subunit [Bacteroidota bacterium]